MSPTKKSLHTSDCVSRFFSTQPKISQHMDKFELSFCAHKDSSYVVVPILLEDEKWHVVTEDLSDEVTSYLNGCLEKFIGCSKTQTHELVHKDKTYLLVPFSAKHAKNSVFRASKHYGQLAASKLSSALDKLNSLAFATSSYLSLPHVFNGWANACYKISGFKQTKSDKKSESALKLTKLFVLGNSDETLKKAILDQLYLAKAQMVTRHLGDTPSNLLVPEDLAMVAEELGKQWGFKTTVLDQKTLQELGMHSLLSVSKGSANPPKVVIAELQGTKDKDADISSKDKSPVVLVGKGVTFDSGGISLKPPGSMHEMKYDMLGGATVLGAMCYLSYKKPKHSVVALIGCVENMPAHDATRPGDVVESFGGKSIEILNTDAEGRLVLADLFGYACKTYNPKFMLDAATLTGACLVALGSVGAAVLSNKDALAEYILKSAKSVQEPLWQLPLWPEYEKSMDSTVADYKNISSSSIRSGTITAGIFLSKFVDKKTPWAHFDIAGTGWKSQALGYPSKGASGYGVEMMATAALNSDSFQSQS